MEAAAASLDKPSTTDPGHGNRSSADQGNRQVGIVLSRLAGLPFGRCRNTDASVRFTGGDSSSALAALPSLVPSPRCLQARYQTRSSAKLQPQRVYAPETSFRCAGFAGNGAVRDKNRISGGRLSLCAQSLHRSCTGLCTAIAPWQARPANPDRILSGEWPVMSFVAFDSQIQHFAWHAIPRALQRSRT